MAKNLLIVESPAKAKTIEKILGKDFTVKSSFGHVRDLDKDSKATPAIDVKNNFKPNYIVTPDKLKVVKDLKDLAAKSDEVWLATDEDREGEAIAWHLAEVLNLNKETTKRIVFREITKPAITKAVQNPRTIDIDLVNAQQARRVLDRLVGFELSELLWKKIKGQLSAGRVQSVAVKLVVEREREIQKHNATPYYKITAVFEVKNAQGKVVSFKADGPERFDKESDAEAFLQKCVGAAFSVKDIKVSPTKRKPAPPFTTSTLQQEASRKLSFSVNRTMQVAQHLYEAGHITYMRTDSTNLSETAIQSMAEAIEKNYGKQYVQTRRFKTGKAGAQEAHEAIRPTYIETLTAGATRDEQRLYELIWKRAIASQMADAELEKTTVNIAISSMTDTLQAVGEVLKFDGFLKVYLESTDDEDDEETAVLPPLVVGQPLALREMNATERYTRPAPRYSEASLVKKLEELGIGRPSTFAPTISKIMEETRGYVKKENRDGTQRAYAILTLKKDEITKKMATETIGTEKGKLFATDMGFLVVDFLDDHFKQIMTYGFTASIEDTLDSIADGKTDWVKFLGEFYHPFHKDVEKTLKESERVSGERILGIDPKSGRTMLVRVSNRTGKPIVQIGKPDELKEGEKPAYANLKPGQSVETITLEDAIGCFELPKILGELDGQEVLVGAGRFGPYVKFGASFISIPRGEDAFAVTYERALEIIAEKRKADAPIGEHEGKPITKGTGKFGPFLKWDDLYVNIPKASGFTLQNITAEGAIELIKAKQEKESNKYLKQWEDEGIAIEMGRFGPFIRYAKKFYRLPPGYDGRKMDADEAALLSLEEAKRCIVEQGGVLAKKK